MLSPKDLADIVKDEIENQVRKVEILLHRYTCYYILLDGKMYRVDDYDVEVEEGKRSANDIYALVDEWNYSDFDEFLFHTNYLGISSVNDIVKAYLRKMGFTLEYLVAKHPTPNLKYFINVNIKVRGTEPEYLSINVYDIDALARTFHIPQIAEQRLGSKRRRIPTREFTKIYNKVADEQPLLAGYTYSGAYNILYNYYVRHDKNYKDKAYKVTLAYSQLFPEPYKVCYEWKAKIFVKIDCLKIVIHSFSS